MSKEERELRRAIAAEIEAGNADELIAMCQELDEDERAWELTQALLARAAKH